MFGCNNAKGPAASKADIEKSKYEKPGDIISNSIGMKLIYIPAGEFMMGSPSDDDDRGDIESLHRVRISKGFWMGITEVTQRQWKAVMDSNPSYFKGDDLPVVDISWNDAVEFCRKLSRREGRQYCLPTEAQWEYACRAGSSSTYSFGDDVSQIGDYVWYETNCGGAQPVGQKKPNAFGLYDIHGNAWEWCQDWYGKDYYSVGPAVDPTGPSSGKTRVLRGGGWSHSAYYCRVAYRHNYSPYYRDFNGGLRVVLLDKQ